MEIGVHRCTYSTGEYPPNEIGVVPNGDDDDQR